MEKSHNLKCVPLYILQLLFKHFQSDEEVKSGTMHSIFQYTYFPNEILVVLHILIVFIIYYRYMVRQQQKCLAA